MSKTKYGLYTDRFMPFCSCLLPFVCASKLHIKACDGLSFTSSLKYIDKLHKPAIIHRHDVIMLFYTYRSVYADDVHSI